jgi:hypothetical protein
LIRLAASVVIEQNDEWLVGRRYLSNHSLEAILDQDKQDNNDREETRELTHPEQPTINPTSYTTSLRAYDRSRLVVRATNRRWRWTPASAFLRSTNPTSSGCLTC